MAAAAAFRGVMTPERQPPVRAVVPIAMVCPLSASGRESTTRTSASTSAPLPVARGSAFSKFHRSGSTSTRFRAFILAQARAAMPMFSGKRVRTRMMVGVSIRVARPRRAGPR